MKTRSDALFVLFLLVFAIFYFSFLNRSELILCGPRQFFFDYPIRFLWLSEFFAGHLPWISNAVSGGIPLWADPNLAIFYPGNFVYLILPFDHAWNALLIFHLFWGAAGMYWLCREWKLSAIASSAGAFTFLFSSPVLAALNSSEVLITASWLPWIFGLVYFGLQQGFRKILFASIALAFQWFGGFTFIQAFTLLLVVITLAFVYLRTRDSVTFLRFLLLTAGTLLITAIQWIPAVLWIPHSDTGLQLTFPEWRPLPYWGVTSTLLFLFGLRNRIVWGAMIAILADGLLFSWSPISSISLGFGAAIGVTDLIRKFEKPVFQLIPLLILIELLIVNLQVPHILSLSQIRKVPPEVTQLPELKRWNVHCSADRSALFGLAGLNWGVHYGTPPEGGLMLWKPLPARKRMVEELIHTRKSPELLREAAIGYAISETQLDHPQLGLINQKATRFFIYRLKLPVYPKAVSSNGKVNIQEIAANQMLIETDGSGSVTIYRNALPGWKCRAGDKFLPIVALESGWMQIHPPAGKNQIQLLYRTPGSLIGTVLSALGTILILAILLL